MQIRSVGIDLGKTSFHLVAVGDNGEVLLKKKFTQKLCEAFCEALQVRSESDQLPELESASPRGLALARCSVASVDCPMGVSPNGSF